MIAGLYMRPVLMDRQTDILFNQRKFLLGPSVTVYLPVCLYVSIFNRCTEVHTVQKKKFDNQAKR